MTVNHKMIWNEVKDYLYITLGLVMYAIAFTVFLLPYQIVSGGVTGLSAIIYYATGFHLENTYIIINIALLIVALKILGFKFMMKTIYAIFALYLLLMLAQAIMPTQDNGLPIKLLGGTGSVCDAQWPSWNEEYLVESQMKMGVAFNGKTRFEVQFPADATNDVIEQTIRADERTAKYVEGKQIMKVIIVPKRMVNIVVK